MAATRAGRAFYIATVSVALSIGALQMYRIRAGWLTDYGADVFGTAWVYTSIRFGGTLLQRGRPASAVRSAVVVFVLCAGWELGQRYHGVPGTYDPYDILTYAVTAVLCWWIDWLAPFVQLQRTPERPVTSLQ